MILFKILHSQLLFVLVGGFLHSLLFRRKKEPSPLCERIGLIYILGVGGLGFSLFILVLLGALLTHALMVLVSLLAGMGWIILSYRRLRRFLAAPGLPRLFPGKKEPWSVSEWILLAALILVVFLQFQQAIRLPLLGYDSRAHWAFKTKVLHHEGTFYTESFYDPERIHPQVRHPVLLPLSQVVVTMSLGVYDDRLLKIPLVLVFASVLCLFYGELSRYFHRRPALAFTLVLALIPRMTTQADGGLTSGYADAPMALYFLATVIFYVRWLQKGEFRDAGCAALLGVFAMYIKDDALGCICAVLGGVFFASLAMKSWKWQKRWTGLLLYFGLTLLLLFPGRRYTHSLSVGKGEYFEALLNFETVKKNWDRLGMIFSSYNLEFFHNIPHWGFLWFFLLFSVIYNRRRFRSPEVLCVALTVLFYFLVLTFIFIILPWKLAVFFPGSLARLVMHLAPISIYLISLLWVGRVSGCERKIPNANT